MNLMTEMPRPKWLDHMWNEDTFAWLDSLDHDSFYECLFLTTEYFSESTKDFSSKMFLSEDTVIRLLRSKSPDYELASDGSSEGGDIDPLFDLLLDAAETSPLLYKLSGLLLGVDFTPERAEEFVGAFVLPYLHPKQSSRFWGSESLLISSLLNHPQVPVDLSEVVANTFLMTYKLSDSPKSSPYRTAAHRAWLSILDGYLPPEALGRLADRLIRSLEADREKMSKEYGFAAATKKLDGTVWLELLTSLTQHEDFPEDWVMKHQAGESPIPVLHRAADVEAFADTFPVTHRGFVSVDNNALLDLGDTDVSSGVNVPVKWLRPEEVSDKEAFELGRRAVLQIPGGQSEVHFAGWYLHCLRERMDAQDVPLEWLLLAESE